MCYWCYSKQVQLIKVESVYSLSSYSFLSSVCPYLYEFTALLVKECFVCCQPQENELLHNFMYYLIITLLSRISAHMLVLE